MPKSGRKTRRPTPAAGVLGAWLLIAPAAAAGQADTTAGFERGQELYEAHCALCHQESGQGDPPTFPALNGNDRLEDSARIVRNIYRGAGTMPPFPDLEVEDIAALVQYVRGAWENDFPEVAAEEVAAALDGLDETGGRVSVWDGVFTQAQADRGQTAYTGACGICHGRRLNGAPDDPDMRSTPPLARAGFLREWDGRSLATLYEYMRATMPEDNPGSLTDPEYVDVIAYMLSVGGMPTGPDALPPDPPRLSRIAIEQRP